MRHLKIVYRRFRYGFYVSIIGGSMSFYNSCLNYPGFGDEVLLGSFFFCHHNLQISLELRNQ